MATVNYGLSREGFKRKRLPEILSDMESRFSDALGVPIETTANSVLGQLFGVVAYEISDMWQMGEEVYHAMYPNTATGTSLSNAAGLAGITTITAEYTTITATVIGTNGTRIPYGSRIQSRTDTSKVFSSLGSNAYIDAANASMARITVPEDPVQGTVYTLTISGKQYSYTAEANPSRATVLTGLGAAINLGGTTTTVDNNVLTVQMIDAQQTFSIAAGDMLLISDIGSPVRFQAETAGAVNPAIGEVDQIITPVSGWDSVINNVPAVVGRDAESDTALRQRWSNSLYERSSAMVDAIQAAIYQQADGVTTAIVYENNTDTTDAEGRPPHSIEAVVEGGDINDIAKQIWNKKAAGIDTYGDVSVEIYDSQGAAHTIHFNRPEQVIVWIRIVIRENPDEIMPAAALQEIKDAVLTKGQSQTVGQDVILQRYFSEIFRATAGVGYIDLTAATGTTAGTYSADNITISPRQIAVFDASRIEVTKNE